MKRGGTDWLYMESELGRRRGEDKGFETTDPRGPARRVTSWSALLAALTFHERRLGQREVARVLRGQCWVDPLRLLTLVKHIGVDVRLALGLDQLFVPMRSPIFTEGLPHGQQGDCPLPIPGPLRHQFV